MSKYEKLWVQVKNRGANELKLTFDEITQTIGFPLDHSLLKYKKELPEYGYEVEKISMKDRTVTFRKID